METVIVLKPGLATDPFSGEQTESWENPISTTYENCVIEPVRSEEPVEDGRSALIVGYTAYLPYTADVTADDRIILFGETWNIDGRPFAWKNPFTGREAGLEVQVRGVIG